MKAIAAAPLLPNLALAPLTIEEKMRQLQRRYVPTPPVPAHSKSTYSFYTSQAVIDQLEAYLGDS